jgi:hypothetical protein
MAKAQRGGAQGPRTEIRQPHSETQIPTEEVLFDCRTLVVRELRLSLTVVSIERTTVYFFPVVRFFFVPIPHKAKERPFRIALQSILERLITDLPDYCPGRQKRS